MIIHNSNCSKISNLDVLVFRLAYSTLVTVVDNEIVEILEESDESEEAREAFGLPTEVPWLYLVYQIKPAK